MSVKNMLKTRMNNLAFSEKYFENLAIFLFAVGIFIAALIIVAAIVTSIALCIESESIEFLWIAFCGPFAAFIELAFFEFLAMLFAGFADIIANNKKQTELLKVVAMK